MPQNRPVGLAVLATLPLDAFLDASLSMIRRGEGENAGTFTVKPGTYEPIFGIYDPVGGCGGTMGTVLDRDFEIDPHDITYTMMEPLKRRMAVRPHRPVHPSGLLRVLRSLRRAHRVFREEA